MTMSYNRLAVLLAITLTTCHAFMGVANPSQRQRILVPLLGSYFDEEDEDDREFASIRQRGTSRRRPYAEDEERMLEDLEEVVDEYMEDFDGVIPNPLLDNIDPEGSAERFPELLQDRQFWVDIALLALFLNLMDNLRDPAVFDAIDLANGFQY